MEATKFPDHLQAVEDFLAAGAKPGEIITHEWLDEHLKLDPRSSKYGIEKVRKVQLFKKELLLQYSIDIKSVLGQGYYVVPPQEQTKLALHDTKTAVKKSIQSGLTRLTHIDHGALTEDQEKANTNAVLALSSMGSSIAKGLREKRVNAIAAT